jgi:hypothetical protein
MSDHLHSGPRRLSYTGTRESPSQVVTEMKKVGQKLMDEREFEPLSSSLRTR